MTGLDGPVLAARVEVPAGGGDDRHQHAGHDEDRVVDEAEEDDAHAQRREEWPWAGTGQVHARREALAGWCLAQGAARGRRMPGRVLDVVPLAPGVAIPADDARHGDDQAEQQEREVDEVGDRRRGLGHDLSAVDDRLTT